MPGFRGHCITASTAALCRARISETLLNSIFCRSGLRSRCLTTLSLGCSVQRHRLTQLFPPFLFSPPLIRRRCCAPAEYALAHSPGFGHAAGCLPGSLCLGRRISLISSRRAEPMGSALRWREGCRLRLSVPSFVGRPLLTHSLIYIYIYIYICVCIFICQVCEYIYICTYTHVHNVCFLGSAFCLAPSELVHTWSPI